MTPTPRRQLLIPLLAALNVVRRTVPRQDRKVATSTAKQITRAAEEGALVSSAVSQSVAATMTAIMVAITVPVVVSTS